MQLATTLQFRKAVRKYIAKKGLRSYGSWTNPSKPGQRTVGFAILAGSDEMAAKIEGKLNKKGLTAQVRCTDASVTHPSVMYNGGYTYIRGTCAFV